MGECVAGVRHYSAYCETKVRRVVLDVSTPAEFSVIDDSDIPFPQCVIIKVWRIKRQRFNFWTSLWVKITT